MEFETIIGIEIHCELKTNSKMFSGAQNIFGASPNTSVSKIDMAFPGTMPRVNKKAIEYAIMACTALNLEIDRYVAFDRKNYFYSDLPKGYQITQDKHPIGRNGYLDIETNGVKKRIGIERLHMEEDTAKQLHFKDFSLINYNRCGVPLIEIVSKPDIRNGLEAASYVEKLRSILLYTGVSDVKMEEGSMRCDVNVSIREKGSNIFGTKTEIKNLNSISNVMKAVDYEVNRQKEVVLRGEKVKQETRRYDEELKQTVVMREKTDAVDYKYFTEPNIAPIVLGEEFVKRVQAMVPELPGARFERYVNKLGLTEYDANVILNNKDISDYFDSIVKNVKNAKLACNFLMSNVLGYLNKENKDIKEFIITSDHLSKLINMIDNGVISSKQGKIVFEEMLKNNDNPEDIAKRFEMIQISDEGFIMELINQVLSSNEQVVINYKQGKTNVLGFLVGQVLKLSKGKANPALVNKLMLEEINKR